MNQSNIKIIIMKTHRNKSLTLSVSVLILAAITGCSLEEKNEPGIVIMAYYVAGDNFVPNSIPVEKLTHIIYSFTEVIDDEMAFVLMPVYVQA